MDHVQRPNAPPLDRVYAHADTQRSEDDVRRLIGHAVLEFTDSILKADEIDYNEDTGDATARGHVFYQNFTQKEQLYCDRLEYNVDTEIGKFYNVAGYSHGRIDVRPGMLISDNPFYFQARWVERKEDHYILHDGLITGCKLPNPWWTLRGPRFLVVPNQHAIAYNSWFHLRRLPLFYTPFFYKSLEKVPRQSGFLTPSIGHSSLFGYFFGFGYYWAINRSYDMTYRLQEYTAGATAHTLDFRGKPNAKTDFDILLYGAESSIIPPGQNQSYSGMEATVKAKSDLGGGWMARGNIDYISSLGFRQQFATTYNAAIFSESESNGALEKHFDQFNFTVDAQRIQLFQDVTPNNYVILRKLPEVDLATQDRELTSGSTAITYAYDADASLLHRFNPVEPAQDETGYSTSQFMPRLDLEPRIGVTLHDSGFSLTPSFTAHETFYGDSFASAQTPVNPSTGLTGSSINRGAAEFNLELILPSIERVYNRKTFLGDKLKHVIEARANYKYINGVSELNRIIRFDTTDILADTNQLGFTLTNRLYAKRGNSVVEVLTWDLSQERYFDPSFGGALIAGQRNVFTESLELTAYAFLNQPRNYSPIASNVRANPVNGLTIEWQADYDPLRKGVIDSQLQADLHRHKIFFSAANYETRGVPLLNSNGQQQTGLSSFLSPPSNQFRATAGYGDANRKGLSFGGSFGYDYRVSVLQYTTAQVIYNTDCCGFSAQLARINVGIRDDTQYRFAFTIANVGSFGTLKRQERIF